MLVKTKGIVLKQTRYTDSSIIINFYTENYGKQSFIYSRTKSKKGKNRFNIVQSLFLLDIEFYYKPKADIYRIKELSQSVPLNDIPYNIKKSSIALFLSEFLYRVLYERIADSETFKYLYYSIQLLDKQNTTIANFHLVFLIQFSKYLGIFPNNNFSETNIFFDLIDAEFKSQIPNHKDFLDIYESKLLNSIINCSLNNFYKLNISKDLRNNIIDKILQFHYIHLDGMKEINSFRILKDIFE